MKIKVQNHQSKPTKMKMSKHSTNIILKTNNVIIKRHLKKYYLLYSDKWY